MKLDQESVDGVIKLMVWGSVCLVFITINLFFCYCLLDERVNNNDIIRFLTIEFGALLSAFVYYMGGNKRKSDDKS